MNFLLDTQILVWTMTKSDRLPEQARSRIADQRNSLHFSVISLWEVAIKRGLQRSEFNIDPRLLRRALLDSRYTELAVTGLHAVAIDGLPILHKDPFDRMLVAQALVEGLTLLTTDSVLARYPCSICRV